MQILTHPNTNIIRHLYLCILKLSKEHNLYFRLYITYSHLYFGFQIYTQFIHSPLLIINFSHKKAQRPLKGGEKKEKQEPK